MVLLFRRGATSLRHEHPKTAVVADTPSRLENDNDFSGVFHLPPMRSEGAVRSLQHIVYREATNRFTSTQ